MCQSLVVSSFSVAAEALPTIMLSINFYKFAGRSPLRIVMEPLVILIPPSALENLYPRASNERRFFFKFETCRTFVRVRICPLNILIQMLPIPTVFVVFHQDRASIIKLVSTEPLLFLGTCDMCTPSQVTKHISIYLFPT